MNKTQSQINLINNYKHTDAFLVTFFFEGAFLVIEHEAVVEGAFLVI